MGLPTTVICVSLLALLGVTTGQSSGCHQTCPLNFDPVCGSDERTYVNECALKKKAECDNQRITIAHTGTCDTRGGSVSSQHRYHRPPYYRPSPQDATEEPTTVLSDIYTPWNNGTKEFEDRIAASIRDINHSGSPLLQKFLHDVTPKLQEAIRSHTLDPLAVGSLEFDVGNIEVKIDPGTVNGLSSVVLNGGLLENPHGKVIGVTVSGDLGELMGFSGGVARQNLPAYNFGVSSTTDSITVLMDVKLDKVACKLTVEDVNIKLGKIKIDVTGVPSIIDEIKNSVVLKFGFHLEKLLKSQSYDLKILINTALSSILKSDALKNKLDCDRHK